MSSISGTKYASILYNGAASNSWGFNYSNLYDNSGGPYTLYSGGSEGDTSTMSGLIEDDPLYNDVSSSDATDWDLTLASGSPNIDAGDPELLDTDGTTSDIGAYGGPDAAW